MYVNLSYSIYKSTLLFESISYDICTIDYATCACMLVATYWFSVFECHSLFHYQHLIYEINLQSIHLLQ